MHYGRKLEPRDGLILHGAGQNELPAFLKYGECVQPNRPLIYMTYTSLKSTPGQLAGYINWNWSGYPQWHDWGDGRLELNETVRSRYAAEMSDARYVHDGPRERVRAALGLT